MPFAGSLYVNNLFKKTDQQTFQNKINELISILEITPSKELVNFLSQNPINKKYRDMLICLDKCKSSLVDAKFEHLKKYFAAKTLAELPMPEISPFDPNSVYPSQFEEILKLGAEGLFNYGKIQFVTLKIICDSVVSWCSINQLKNITLIESPLGNVVPIQILARLLALDGKETKIWSLSIPRNDRANKGITISEIIKTSISDIILDTECIIYMDDVITGTRYKKVFATLEKELKKIRSKSILLPCAIVCKPRQSEIFRWKKEYSDNLAYLKDKLENISYKFYFNPWQTCPPVPLMKVDNGNPIMYESTLIWGEQPIVAGKKKANLIFNMIEQFKCILNDLASNKKIRNILHVLWSIDTNNNKYIIKDSVMGKLFTDIAVKMDWSLIQSKATKRFQADYIGRMDNISFDEVKERFDWVHKMVYESAKKYFVEAEASILMGALTDMFNFADQHYREARDYSYCNYILEYNYTMRGLNLKLIDLILNYDNRN